MVYLIQEGIDQHRDAYGVEPICAVLPIAPSTYFRRRAQQDDATTRSPRARLAPFFVGVLG